MRGRATRVNRAGNTIVAMNRMNHQRGRGCRISRYHQQEWLLFPRFPSRVLTLAVAEGNPEDQAKVNQGPGQLMYPLQKLTPSLCLLLGNLAAHASFFHLQDSSGERQLRRLRQNLFLGMGKRGGAVRPYGDTDECQHRQDGRNASESIDDPCSVTAGQKKVPRCCR